MKTIIQTIGPLYGDDVNGTVFGQPNGSIATSPNNVYTISKSTDFVYVKGNPGNLMTYDSGGNLGPCAVIGFSLQSAAYAVCALYTTAACTTRVTGTGVQFGPAVQGGSRSLERFTTFGFSGTITAGTKYYARMEFYLNGDGNGLIATSEVIELEGI